MSDIYCYSYVEDEPSAAVAEKLLLERNTGHSRKMHFFDGFPRIMNGYGEILQKAPKFLDMAKAGLHTFCITDLDRHLCPASLIQQWFLVAGSKPVILPKQVTFRVAVREIEAWLLADREKWANYIGIPVANFEASPEVLLDPKEHLLNVLRRKGRTKRHRQMLPQGRTAQIGPRYNEVLCDFVRRIWSPTRASKNAPSLRRAIDALNRL